MGCTQIRYKQDDWNTFLIRFSAKICFIYWKISLKVLPVIANEIVQAWILDRFSAFCHSNHNMPPNKCRLYVSIRFHTTDNTESYH
jgi:hypothetical protein